MQEQGFVINFKLDKYKSKWLNSLILTTFFVFLSLVIVWLILFTIGQNHQINFDHFKNAVISIGSLCCILVILNFIYQIIVLYKVDKEKKLKNNEFKIKLAYFIIDIIFNFIFLFFVALFLGLINQPWVPGQPDFLINYYLNSPFLFWYSIFFIFLFILFLLNFLLYLRNIKKRRLYMRYQKMKLAKSLQNSEIKNEEK